MTPKRLKKNTLFHTSPACWCVGHIYPIQGYTIIYHGSCPGNIATDFQWIQVLGCDIPWYCQKYHYNTNLPFGIQLPYNWVGKCHPHFCFNNQLLYNLNGSSILYLVGGWTNPIEKYARHIESWNPDFFGVKIKHIWVATTWLCNTSIMVVIYFQY